MKRRDFLKNAGAAIVPAALPAALWSSASPTSEGETPRPKGRLFAREQVPLTAVLYDERYADCRAFAEALERHGAKAFATNRDAVAVWYGPLHSHLEKNPGRIAGLATYADFSSSIACGRELGYSLHFEGHHDARRSATALAHRLITRADSRGDIVAIANPNDIASALAEGDWAPQLAEALWRMGEPVPAKFGPEAPTLPPGTSREAKTSTARASGHVTYLSSWLLGPKPAV
jgi:hypothetical protein